MTGVILAVFLLAVRSVASTNYCEITRQHTLCNSKSIGPQCGTTVPDIGVTSEEIKTILDEHNRLRARVANGQEKRGLNGEQPPSSNMRRLVWDNELANIAQAHANQCIFEHDCPKCRKTDRFSVGQNLFTSSSTARSSPDPPDWKRAINEWYNEVAIFDRDFIQPFRFASDVGHYTQMIWADVMYVGCGYIFHRNDPWWTKLYTCNYGPGGNFIRGEMYKRGTPCAQCPESQTCSKTFPGLCEEPRSSGTIAPPNTAFTSTTTTTETAITTTTTRPTTTYETTTTFITTTSAATDQTTSLTAEEELFSCDLDRTGCRVKYVGSVWKVIRSDSNQGRFLGTAVGPGKTTRLTIEHIIPPTESGRSCIRFSYLKYQLRGRAVTNLEIRAVPISNKGSYVRFVESKNARGQMEKRVIQMFDLKKPYRILFLLSTPAGSINEVTAIALDDFRVTAGEC